MIDKLAAYENAEEQGRLVVLPVALGETVWCLEGKRIFEVQVRDFLVGEHGANRMIVTGEHYTPTVKAIANIGKTVFATRAEAQAALEAQGGANNDLQRNL